MWTIPFLGPHLTHQKTSAQNTSNKKTSFTLGFKMCLDDKIYILHLHCHFAEAFIQCNIQVRYNASNRSQQLSATGQGEDI